MVMHDTKCPCLDQGSKLKLTFRETNVLISSVTLLLMYHAHRVIILCWFTSNIQAALPSAYLILLCCRTNSQQTPSTTTSINGVSSSTTSMQTGKCTAMFCTAILALCKKASNHHANLPLEMYSFTL